MAGRSRSEREKILRAPKKLTIIPLGTRNSTFISAPIKIGEFTQGVLMSNVTAVSGSSPTLDMLVQVSLDGQVWADMEKPVNPGTGELRVTVGFDTISWKGSKIILLSNFPEWLRLYCLIGGASPSFTFSVEGTFK